MIPSFFIRGLSVIAVNRLVSRSSISNCLFTCPRVRGAEATRRKNVAVANLSWTTVVNQTNGETMRKVVQDSDNDSDAFSALSSPAPASRRSDEAHDRLYVEDRDPSRGSPASKPRQTPPRKRRRLDSISPSGIPTHSHGAIDRANFASCPAYGETDGSNHPAQRWNVSPSLRNDFAAHEPLSMFPDQSSTLPYNSSTQRQLLDEARAEEMRVETVDLVAQLREVGHVSSVPWSNPTTSSSVCSQECGSRIHA